MLEYNCDQCDRVFPRYEQLERHYRKHTGEKPFICPIAGCGKKCSRSDNLQQHIKCHSKVKGNIAKRDKARAFFPIHQQTTQIKEESNVQTQPERTIPFSQQQQQQQQLKQQQQMQFSLPPIQYLFNLTSIFEASSSPSFSSLTLPPISSLSPSFSPISSPHVFSSAQDLSSYDLKILSKIKPSLP